MGTHPLTQTQKSDVHSTNPMSNSTSTKSTGNATITNTIGDCHDNHCNVGYLVSALWYTLQLNVMYNLHCIDYHTISASWYILHYSKCSDNRLKYYVEDNIERY